MQWAIAKCEHLLYFARILRIKNYTQIFISLIFGNVSMNYCAYQCDWYTVSLLYDITCAQQGVNKLLVTLKADYSCYR